ncbi:hypothetical protein Y032_0814g2489 [Ancylostoma ceylanicum]|uniref:Choline transporter-like protein n=1 Tax=Ancylostoma ceylanicum TaxID=53326 RepID=A0A016WDY9_9BILA|nr:hypothetical protein Y032_0814g2489 [Ancylostoma ceylanicum]
MSRRFASPTPRSPVMCSLWNLVRYHLGSAALGAFIITLVRIPRYIIIWTLARMRSVENLIVKKILAVFVFILGCIEKCLRYINYNVYTVISYSGFSFCPAAKMAVNHLLDNAIDVATVNTVGDLVLFLTKCLVAGATTICAFFRLEELWTSLSHPWFPLVILFICSYQIANCFLSVYEMTIDTIMLCCAEELVLLRDNPEAVQQFRSVVPGKGGAAELCDCPFGSISQSPSSIAPPYKGTNFHKSHEFVHATHLKDFMDGTAEVMAQRNVQLIGCTRIEETYPLNTIDDERK